ncbi:WhiB family transcriptional regulator [Kutzneria albida]|uniref:4Fe-4S Wbl-type domain-containing protein n=1 Tax=Kutzneria albida DSM 43870 TaxID=1449976 RepID=W5W8Y1_9PSEU|nr:WhiB family transcriptional regulator [Kutzneria albida]AHH97608.1 hypothetical protein KALB_4245 [Kutzneria albida DSM 43870]
MNDLWLITIAWRLDRLRWVPRTTLAEIVQRDGSCMSVTTTDEPSWQGEHLTNRELATRLCEGCPVQDECLELELRTAGEHTVGVWGALAEDDRQQLHPYWLQRGDRVDGREADGGLRP